MVKKFYIFSCAALVACLCLFPQDAGATARQSEATALAPGASAGTPIRLAQEVTVTTQKSRLRQTVVRDRMYKLGELINSTKRKCRIVLERSINPKDINYSNID